MIAAIGLVIGVIAGLVFHPTVPDGLAPYLPIAVVAALDAIGDPKSMAAKFADGADGRYLFALKSQYGIRFDTSTEDHLSLPAATQLSLTEAVPVP